MMPPSGEIRVSKHVLAGLKRRIEFLERDGFDLTKPGMRAAVEALEAALAVCDSATANAISNITKLYDGP